MSSAQDAGAHDLEAEAAVLAAVLLDQDAMARIGDVLAPQDFFSVAHQRIYEAIVAVEHSGSTVDVVTVATALRDGGRLESIGGTPYLAQLTDATPAVAHVVEHARIVQRLSRVRRTLDVLRRAVAVGQTEGRANPGAWLEQVEHEVLAAAACAGPSALRAADLADVMDDAVRCAVEASRAPRALVGTTTGFTGLDALTTGYRPGKLWVIAGRPGQGKTAWTTGSLITACEASGDLGVFFSLEMDRGELGVRMLSGRAGVASKRIEAGVLNDDEWSRVTTAAASLARVPVRVDDNALLTPSILRARLRRHVNDLRRKHGPKRLGFVAVDYLQLMQNPIKGASTADELAGISRAMKLLAKEEQCTVLLLSQLNRSNDASDKRPSLRELKGTSAIEADADVVMFIHREDGYRTNRMEHDGHAELIVAKGRGCGTGVTAARFVDTAARFEDADGGYRDDRERFQ